MVESAVGLGFDVHPFADVGELWLGGLLFEGEVGLSGHSDGDVVCHAVADALLGAVAMGDIGEHFPETAPETAGIAGEELLGRTLRILSDRGRAPVSMDVTVVCDRPQIAPRRVAGGPQGGELSTDAARSVDNIRWRPIILSV